MDTPEFLKLQQKLKSQLEDDILRVYVFNVSQGDHILIKLPNGQFGIIDFFHSSSGLNQTSPPGIDFLKQVQRILPDQEITLAFIYLSHPDYDHLKGITHLLDWLDDPNRPIKVRHLWWFGGNNLNKFFTQLENLSTQYLYQNLDAKLKKKRIAPFKKKLRGIQSFVANRRKDSDFRTYNLVDIGPLCNFKSEGEIPLVKVFKKAPLSDHIEQFKDNVDGEALRTIEYYLKLNQLDNPENENISKSKSKADNNTLSGVIKMTYKHYKLFFGGDAPSKVFKDCFKQYDHQGLNDDNAYPDFDAHFIKAAHHGSHNSSELEIWERLLNTGDQRNIHVSFSAGFKYGHPHEETLNHIYKEQNKIPNAVRIDSTNEQHLDNLRYPTECMNWLYEPIENEDGKDQDAHPDPRIFSNKSPSDSLGNMEDKGYSPHPDPRMQLGRRQAKVLTAINEKMLAAFIYEFDPTQDQMSVKKGMTQKYEDNRTKNRRRSFLPF